MFCPHCGARLGDRPDLAGQWFSCPGCAAPFQVPLPPPQPSGILQHTAAQQPAVQQTAVQQLAQQSAAVHQAHAAGQSGPLQKAIPVKQAVAVGPAAQRQPAEAVRSGAVLSHTAQSHTAQSHTAQSHSVQSHSVPSQMVHAAIPVSNGAAAPLAATVHAAAVQPVPHTQPRAPVHQGVPVKPMARRRHSPTAAVPRHPTDGLAVVGLGLGLLGLPLGLAPYYGLVVSGFGAALALGGMVAAVKRRRPGGLAVAALAISGIGLCFQVTMWNLYWRERPETQYAGNGAAPSAAGPKPSTAPAATASSSAAPDAASPTAAGTPAAATTDAGYEPWQKQRLWTIGDKQVLARLKGWSGARAILQLADGDEMNTSQSALSADDLKWVADTLGK